VSQTVTELGKQALATLPPGFTSLLVINTVFILGLLWFLDRNHAAEVKLLGPLLNACVEQVPLGALPHLAPNR
jgi:hypothetical protein